MLAAVVTAGIGYTEGALLARIFGAWQVICWALLCSVPLVLLLLWRTDVAALRAAPVTAWLAFAYIGAVSMWLAFFAWYRGMAWGGALRVSQVQLLQPFVSVLLSVPLLGERLEPATLAFSIAVMACVYVGRRMSTGARK